MPGRTKPIRLRPQAEADLEGIWTYTAETWSPDQAERYTDQIIDSFDDIAADPDRGQDMNEIRTGYRRWSVGRHYVFYKATEDAIEIVRILHQVRDIKRHL